MGFFQNFRLWLSGGEQRAGNGELVSVNNGVATEGEMLTAILGNTAMTKERALQIPTVKAALNLIKGVIRETPLKLYHREEDGSVSEVLNDARVRLLNSDTGDTLNASQFWDAMIEDYFLFGGGYAYINKRGSRTKSLHYVENECVSVCKNDDLIFKDYSIWVQGKEYLPCDFFKILRDTRDGAEGMGIIRESDLLLKVMYNSLKFENNLVSTGGNKKGFLKSVKTLSEEAIAKLKAAWKRLYSSNDENIVVLNSGLEFQESSNTSVELQLNENKNSNAAEVARLLNIPLGMLSGTGTSAASEDDKKKFLDYCALPLMKTITNAADRDLLLESEKAKYFFGFDTKDIQKGSMLERFQAYAIAMDKNIMMRNEIRKIENLPAGDFNYMNIGLSAVLYDPESKQIFVPNTGEKFKLGEKFEGKEKEEDVED